MCRRFRSPLAPGAALVVVKWLGDGRVVLTTIDLEPTSCVNRETWSRKPHKSNATRGNREYDSRVPPLPKWRPRPRHSIAVFGPGCRIGPVDFSFPAGESCEVVADGANIWWTPGAQHFAKRGAADIDGPRKTTGPGKRGAMSRLG